MYIKYLSSILSILLFSTPSTGSPITESYTISLPTHLDLASSGGFNVSVVDQTIDEKDTINVIFPQEFTLSDLHGKNDIKGSISNTKVSFSNNDLRSKTVNYQVDNATVGQWRGNLDVLISLDRKAEGNILIDGSALNEILIELNPSTISFSHNQISGNYLYDISLAQDESILLYKSANEVIITNKQNKQIKANFDMSNLFANLDIATINNLNYLDMSTCSNMYKMFHNCDAIENLDVQSFDTSNVTDMSYVFSEMDNLKTITGIENWDVSNVTTISHLFNEDMALTTIPKIYNWQISNKCTDVSYALCNIAYQAGVTNTSKWDSTATYDFTNWDVSNVTNMSHLFANAFSLKFLDLTGWNTSNVTDMSAMFQMIDSINKSLLATVIGLEDLDVNNVTNMDSIFRSCRNLAADFSCWHPRSVTNLTNAFYDTRKLDITKFENWNQDFNINNVDYTDCFGAQAGQIASKTYRPAWYK